jgi:hypothetical protein
MAAWLLATFTYLVWLMIVSANPGVFGAFELAKKVAEVSAERLGKRLIASAVMATVFMVGLDASVQLIQMLFLGTRKDWSPEKTVFMAQIGAIGGVLGWGLGWLRHVPGVSDYAAYIVKEALSEAIPELIADKMQQAMQGDNQGPDLTPKGGFLGGLYSGIVEGHIGWFTKKYSHLVHGCYQSL